MSAMKLITAVIKGGKFDDVVRAATDAGAHGLTVTAVRGFGQQYGHLSAAPPAGSPALVLPKLRVELAVNDEVADAVLEAIAKSANTGLIGDGKIWICDVERALRVRTGQRDRDAL
jgi:nitrogen regulatory protein P-II 2